MSTYGDFLIAAKQRVYQREYYAKNKDRIAAEKRAAWSASPPRCVICGRTLKYPGAGCPPKYCAGAARLCGRTVDA